jgi:hypothetical protein
VGRFQEYPREQIKVMFLEEMQGEQMQAQIDSALEFIGLR